MRAHATLCLGFAALLSAGCAKRLPLSTAELERVKTEAGVQPLRVYVSKKIVPVYREARIDEQYEVNKNIRESSSTGAVREDVTRNTSGLILKVGELNGETALWVTFSPRYNKPEDALVFVQGGDGLFRLHEVPEREGFKHIGTWVAFRRFAGRKLKLGKMRSLAEPNDVMLLKKSSGKIVTIDLQVKKITSDRSRTRSRKAEGID